MDRRLPPGAWDTHFHIFEPDRFTPAPATLEQFEQFKSSLRVEYICVTHGLSYGSDCTSLLHYLHYFQGRASGICVLDVETTTDDLLDTYHAAGVRSVRLDLFKHEAMHDMERQISLIEATAARLTQWGKGRWSIQIQQPHLEFWGRLRGTRVDPCGSPRRESPGSYPREKHAGGKHHARERVGRFRRAVGSSARWERVDQALGAISLLRS